jgi:hypothetical protein
VICGAVSCAAAGAGRESEEGLRVAITVADVEAARRTIAGRVLRRPMLLKCERFNFRRLFSRHLNRPFNMYQYPLNVDI